MALWTAILDRKGPIALGILLSIAAYAVFDALLDQYVTVLAGATAGGAGYLFAGRGTTGSLDAKQMDDAFAWGFGALIGVIAMHTLSQGGLV